MKGGRIDSELMSYIIYYAFFWGNFLCGRFFVFSTVHRLFMLICNFIYYHVIEWRSKRVEGNCQMLVTAETKQTIAEISLFSISAEFNVICLAKFMFWDAITCERSLCSIPFWFPAHASRTQIWRTMLIHYSSAISSSPFIEVCTQINSFSIFPSRRAKELTRKRTRLWCSFLSVTFALCLPFFSSSTPETPSLLAESKKMK